MLEWIVGVVRRQLVAIVVAIVAIGGTTLAVAANGPSGSSSSGTRIYACVTEEFRTLNLSSSSARCPKGQRKISWSANGRKGDRGSRGPAGQAGADGAAGAPGLPGAPGAQGEAGASGAPGVPGAKGDAGEKGDAGTDGAAGPAGAPGQQGIPGMTGPAGPTGPIGPAGPAGDDGAAGPAGPQGPTGPAGEDGATGPVGPQGAAGEDGAPGPAGPQGPAGEDGENGAVGPAGPAGPTGPAGATGPAGPAGASAVVQATRSLSVQANGVLPTIDNWTIGAETLFGFNPDDGVFTAEEAGTYRVAFDGTAGPTSAVTVSSAANTWLSLGFAVSGSTTDGVTKRFPVLDVNVALILTLRAPLREASVSAERYVTLAAGDTIAMGTANQFSIPMSMSVALTISRVS